jgi:serine/threonine-protein kinase SRPK1
MVSMGMKLPTSLISTAPEEEQPQGKLSKTKKKKLKKKAKLQHELIRMQMEHLMQTNDQDESKGTKDKEDAGEVPIDEHLSASATLSNNDESPTDNETSSHILNGSMRSNASSENENDEKDNKSASNVNVSMKSNDESNEDNEDVDEKMSISSPSERVIEKSNAVSIITTPPTENGTCEQSKRSPKPLSSQFDPAFDICDFEVKIADLGNACWVDKHFTEGEFWRREELTFVLLI